MMKREWFESLLKNEIVTITFTKKNGTEREMRCTLKQTLLPLAEVVESTEEDKPKRAKSETSIAVYDLDVEGWRAFSIDSVKTISFDLGGV
jgi:hypothetical protein